LVAGSIPARPTPLSRANVGIAHPGGNLERVYARNIRPTLGSTSVRKVTTKTLTDLYGAHQARGLGPRSVYQIHACLSSMFTQACRWGWRESNPAQWAEPPSIPNDAPVIATPAEVRALIEAAEQSRRPEYARALLVAATTGLRRGELCGLRHGRDLDLEANVLRVSSSVAALPRTPLREIPTKNRRTRIVALDELTASVLAAQVTSLVSRAKFVGVELVDEHHVFSDSADGSVPWRPTACLSTSPDCASEQACPTSASTASGSSWRRTARRWATP
jgi:integrase